MEALAVEALARAVSDVCSGLFDPETPWVLIVGVPIGDGVGARALVSVGSAVDGPRELIVILAEATKMALREAARDDGAARREGGGS